jgi:hypothetical protein
MALMVMILPFVIGLLAALLAMGGHASGRSSPGWP